MIKEMWKYVNGYEDFYMVSSMGKVKSLRSKKLLKPDLQNGYARVQLNSGGKGRRFSIHRLVAIAHIPNPKRKPQVNHIDHCRSNNSIENLEWVTAKENQRHCINAGRKPSSLGAKNSMSKINADDVLAIRGMYKTKRFTQAVIAKMFSLHPRYISLIVTKKRWGHI